jgi:diadenosine tetraphosphatase ApaH/serine/threonine PP2A family protein phosphatase
VTFALTDGRVDTIGGPNSLDGSLILQEGSKYLLNPGAVGQPRDGDARAAYAIADTSTRQVDLFRLNYPFETTQAKVTKAGLPEVLAQRLAVGR